MDCQAADKMNNTNASTLTTCKYEWFYDPAWNWFIWNVFVWLFPLLCLVGAIANATSFCVIISNRKSFPYVTRQYLSIITASDFLILTCKVSTHYFGYMAYVKANPWTWFTIPRAWGFVWCIVYDFFTYYALVGAQFFQLGLTVDRLIAVAAPMKAKMILTHRRSWLMLGLITVMSLLLPVMFVANRMWNDSTNSCTLRSMTYLEDIYQTVEFYFGRVFLVLALTSGTVAICLLLAWNNQTARRMHSDTAVSEQQKRSNRERQRSLVRISLMLVFINVLFLVTSLPWSLGAFLEDYIKDRKGFNFYLIIMRHFNSLLYANNALTWVTYLMGRNFRQAFFRFWLALCCCCCSSCRRRLDASGSSSTASTRQRVL